VRFVGTLAQLTAAVEDDIKTLRDVRQALSNLKGIKFAPQGKPPAVEEICAFQARFQDPFAPATYELDAGKHAKEASFHVAAVAALCLLRSDGMKKADSKITKQVADVAVTLRGKLELVAEDSADLKTAGKRLLEECEKYGKVSPRAAKAKAATETSHSSASKKSRVAESQDAGKNVNKEEGPKNATDTQSTPPPEKAAAMDSIPVAEEGAENPEKKPEETKESNIEKE
jgi:hypothetical protein